MLPIAICDINYINFYYFIYTIVNKMLICYRLFYQFNKLLLNVQVSVPRRLITNSTPPYYSITYNLLGGISYVNLNAICVKGSNDKSVTSPLNTFDSFFSQVILKALSGWQSLYILIGNLPIAYKIVLPAKTPITTTAL